MATSPSGAFLEERCKVGCTDDANDVVAEVGDAMDINAIVKRSPKGVSKGSGRSTQSSCVGVTSRSDSDPNVASPGTTGSRTGDSNGRSKREFKCKCHKCREFGLGMRSRKLGAFEASRRGLARWRSDQCCERNREIQSGIDL